MQIHFSYYLALLLIPSAVSSLRINSNDNKIDGRSLQGLGQLPPQAAAVVKFWTAERMQEALANGGKLSKETRRLRRTQEFVTGAPWTDTGSNVSQNMGILFYYSTQARAYGACVSFVTQDGTSGRSILATSAHCLYDVEGAYEKTFWSNALFMPNSVVEEENENNSFSPDCSNNSFGCFPVSSAVIDVQADAITKGKVVPGEREYFMHPYDYGYAILDDSETNSLAPDGLDSVVPSGGLAIDFVNEISEETSITALGYAYTISGDVVSTELTYCQLPLSSIAGLYDGTDHPDYISPYLYGCNLNEGSSGGPWVVEGTNDVIGMTSFGADGITGVGSPKLFGNSAECLFDYSKTVSFGTNVLVENCSNTGGEDPIEGEDPIDPCVGLRKKDCVGSCSWISGSCISSP